MSTNLNIASTQNTVVIPNWDQDLTLLNSASISEQSKTPLSKENLLLSLNDLDKKKQHLLSIQSIIQKSLNEITQLETKIKSQITEIDSNPALQIIDNPATKTVETAKKTAEIVGPVLFVDTTQVVKSRDSKGEREHFNVLLIANNEKINIEKLPIDIKKYGTIQQIIIYNGENETALKSDQLAIQRLIQYFSTDFDSLRKEINAGKIDRNGYFANKNVTFDCQRFSYYLQHGVEDTYGISWSKRETDTFRNSKPTPGRFYSLQAKTNDFGKNGSYKTEDMSLHHFMCLTNDVCVSKYGNTGILFTSYQQILDAYFPPEFIKGSLTMEY